VEFIERFMLENDLTVPLLLDQLKQIQRHLLESDPECEAPTVAKTQQLSEIASHQWEKKSR
jgi:hypothetical protein